MQDVAVGNGGFTEPEEPWKHALSTFRFLVFLQEARKLRVRLSAREWQGTTRKGSRVRTVCRPDDSIALRIYPKQTGVARESRRG